MKRSVVFTAALAALLACHASGETARAQGQPSQSQGQPKAMGSNAPSPSGPGYYSDEFAADGFYPGGYSSGGYCGDGGDYGGYGCGDDCGYGCGTDCGGSWMDSSWMDCVGLGQSSRWFVTADYLYVQANFSEATSYVIQDLDQTAVENDTFQELNFQPESSYRFGGGWKLGCCDEECRFLFTRMSSFADDVAPEEGQIPYPVTTPDGGVTFIHANVDTKSWDIEYAKTIPLGTMSGGDPYGCGDACDCCDACGPRCPAWDITWSGGIRFATADWRRDYQVVDDEDFATALADTDMDFKGGGLRVGLLGRRYFGQQGWFSVFVKGDISLLLGDVKVVSSLVTDPDTIDEVTIIQSSSNRNIIPVTELEAGASAQLASYAKFSAGYLFSAWHDLGFRDEFNGFTNPNVAALETNYDDANILGFDGFFARLEVGF